MTTNNPPIAAWAPSTALHKLASRHNNSPRVLTDGPAEFNGVALVRLSDYQRLQATYEEELFQLRQTRDSHFGERMRALEQVDALQAECERWKRGSEIRDEQNQDLRSFIMELKAECEKLRAAMIEAKSYIDYYMYGGSIYREPAAEAIAIIDAAIVEGKGARGGGSNARA